MTSTQEQQMAAMAAAGPPYPSRNAGIGGRPDTKIDVAVSAMFIVIFASLAATHMTIFQRNKRKSHVFIPSGATFGFCMARITTFVMRIVWAKNPQNASVAIAANVFVSAGVILLYIINLIYAQRILRGYHHRFGNSMLISKAFLAYFISVGLVMIMVITCAVLTFYTLDPERLRICGNVSRFGIIYFTVFCFMPIPIVLASRYIPSTSAKKKFGTPGHDRLTDKVIIVLIAGTLLTLESVWRASASFLPARPSSNPAWYHKRAAFYAFIPTIEVLVVILYAASRVDQRFYIVQKIEQKEAAVEATEEAGEVSEGKTDSEHN